MPILPTPPRPFTSDGFSGLISAIYRRIYGRQPSCVDCAIAHDFAYFHGGPHYLKREADKKFLRCVSKSGHYWLARIMYLGVVIGGAWFLPYRNARWAFGYPYPQRGPQGKGWETPAMNVKVDVLHDEVSGEVIAR